MRNSQVALVTGATRGIGLEIALKLGQLGYELVLGYRSNEEAANYAAKKLNQAKIKFKLIKSDLSSADELKHLVSYFSDQHSHLNLLVNNAGGTIDGAFQLMQPRDYLSVIKGNLLGPLQLTLALTPMLVKASEISGGASVVNMSSMAGVTGKEGQIPYATSKGGLIGLTRILASRLGAYGIRVNAIAPGFIRTDMVKDLDLATYQHVLQASAIQRMGEISEVAELVAFLGGSASSYINAQTVRVDGGFLR